MFQMETLAGKWQPNLVHAGFSLPPQEKGGEKFIWVQ